MSPLLSEPVPYYLTLAHVVTSLRQAIKDGRLALQDNDIDVCCYYYNYYPGVGCAIGVALPEEVIEVIKEKRLAQSVVSMLEEKGLVTTNPDEQSAICLIQTLHDNRIGSVSALDSFTTAVMDKLGIDLLAEEVSGDLLPVL